MIPILLKFIFACSILKLSEERGFDLGVIPYVVDEEIYGETVLLKIREAFHEMESHSCLKFIKVTKDDARNMQRLGLYISNPNHTRECVHDVSTVPEVEWKQVTFGYDCLESRQILHALLHGLGMKDEITHPARDQYVRVMWANIAPEFRRLFQWDAEYSPVKVEFDTQSVMLFHDRAFTVNGKYTIEPMVSGLTIQPSDHLSQLDVLRLQILFKEECNNRDVKDLIDVCNYTLKSGYYLKGGQENCGANGDYENVDGDPGANGDDEYVNGAPGANIDDDYVDGVPGVNGDDEYVNGAPGANGDDDYVDGAPGANGEDDGDNEYVDGAPGANGDDEYSDGAPGANGNDGNVDGAPSSNGDDENDDSGDLNMIK